LLVPRRSAAPIARELVLVTPLGRKPSPAGAAFLQLLDQHALTLSSRRDGV
jgi:hypothetical protein